VARSYTPRPHTAADLKIVGVYYIQMGPVGKVGGRARVVDDRYFGLGLEVWMELLRFRGPPLGPAVADLAPWSRRWNLGGEAGAFFDL
jgi:hypothetical protein